MTCRVGLTYVGLGLTYVGQFSQIQPRNILHWQSDWLIKSVMLAIDWYDNLYACATNIWPHFLSQHIRFDYSELNSGLKWCHVLWCRFFFINNLNAKDRIMCCSETDLSPTAWQRIHCHIIKHKSHNRLHRCMTTLFESRDLLIIVYDEHAHTPKSVSTRSKSISHSDDQANVVRISLLSTKRLQVTRSAL